MQTSHSRDKNDQPSGSNSAYFPPIDDETLIQSITEAADKVNPLALFEFAVDPYPPKVVQEVVEAVCMLLGLQLDWNAVKKLIIEEELAPKIAAFHPESVPDFYLEQISQISNLPEMQISNLEKQGLGIGQLGEWIHAIAIYYDVKHKPFIQRFATEFEEFPPEPEVVIEKPKEPEVKQEPKKEKPAPRIVTIKEALESIKNLNKQDIVEVRGYKKPPAGVLLVLEALCILFDAMKVERKNNQIIYEPNYKKLLQDTELFIRKVLTLDYDKIPKDKIKRLRGYIVKPEFEVEKVRKASSSAASFSLLIVSIVQKYDEKSA